MNTWPSLEDPRYQAAITELRALIGGVLPGRRIDVAYGDEPTGIYLRPRVCSDEEDDAVVAAVGDRLIDLQVEGNLLLYVVPQHIDAVATHTTGAIS